MSRILSRLRGKKVVALIATVAILGCGGYAGARHAGLIGQGESDDARSQEAPQRVYYELPEFVVNLNTGNRRTSFLKLRASLELESAASIAQVGTRLPLIVDHFQIYLRELRPEDLSGSAGTYRLREELLKRVQVTVAPVVVSDVVFAEMLVN